MSPEPELGGPRDEAFIPDKELFERYWPDGDARRIVKPEQVLRDLGLDPAVYGLRQDPERQGVRIVKLSEAAHLPDRTRYVG